MRIAQVAPLSESLTPRMPGGAERVVSYLSDELVAAGHEVTLYARGDSITKARLVSCSPPGIRLDMPGRDALALHLVMLERVARERDEFDVIHFHTGYLGFSIARQHRLRHLTTMHGRLDAPELSELFREFNDAPVVSVSEAQRLPAPHAFWTHTVYSGLPRQLYAYRAESAGYLAFLGRISPEMRLDQAIEVATRLGIVLRVAAKVDKADRDYYLHKITPLLHNPYVEFVGEISETEKTEFLGGAQALLFPVDYPEPGGLVPIEAMACGTPVIAYRRGSTPEIIEDRETGFLVDTVEQAVAAVKRLPEISRKRCREVFDARFTAARMAEDYVQIYRDRTSEGHWESASEEHRERASGASEEHRVSGRRLMRTMLGAVAVMTAVSSLSFAQKPPSEVQKPALQNPAGDKAVTYTGCLVAGTTPGAFVLNDGSEVRPVAKPPTNPNAPPVDERNAPSAVSEAKGQALKIQGTVPGFDLAANVNHHVQLTGTVADVPGSQSETPPPDLPPGKSDVLLKVMTVQSAKSLADRCVGF
jgi:glycosyltransferase involved in cell wall biosynthesis